MEFEVISALGGLAGAINNNERTEDSDRIVVKAFAHQYDDVQDMVKEIIKEKFIISPGCAICKNPCGNTSSYTKEEYDDVSDEVKKLKEDILEALEVSAKDILNGHSHDLELFYKGIVYVGYDLDEETFEELLNEIKEG